MRKGGNALLFTAALATAGCVTDSNQVQIRPIADPFIKATRAGSPALAEGRGLLAMGSVGLAIEAFHKALREQPDSIEALAGLAECYDQMGRHDLSQAKYEAALAIAPKDPTLLRTFAASLERQGRLAEAKELRGEADANEREAAAALVRMEPVVPAPVQPRIAPAPVRVAAAPAPPKPEPVKTVTAQPAPAAVAQLPPERVNIAAVEPISAPVKVATAEVRPTVLPKMPAAPQMSSSPLVTRTAWAIEAAPIAPPPEASASVTVKLPAPAPQAVEAPKVAAAVPQATAPGQMPRLREPPRMAVAALPHLDSPEVTLAAAPLETAEVAKTASSVSVKLPPAMPAALPPGRPTAPAVRQIVAEAAPVREGPRLERLSMGEVALVTDRPRRKAEPVRYTAIANTPRFVPLADLPGNYGLRLLNAARHDGLAAQTRLALNGQGWKSVTIGNSARVRQHSLVLYSETTEKAARRLAKQMGIWIAKDARPGPLTVLLGRDWATRRQARA